MAEIERPVDGNLTEQLPTCFGELSVASGTIVVGAWGIAGDSSFVSMQQTAGPGVQAGVVGVGNWVGSSGVYGRNDTVRSFGVQGMSEKGIGVHGSNGASGKKPAVGAGVSGESLDGYGVYGSSSTSMAAYFDGDVRVVGNLIVDGDITLSTVGGTDIAEDFDIRGIDGAVPGSVLVIDGPLSLATCTRPYDRRVAGVVSGAGDFKPGMILGRGVARRKQAPLALTGRAYCLVDANAASIELGDLLTTSTTPGHAMKASDPSKAFGAVLGKALAPLASGTALIPVLIALQ
jgi:hypothetical protein